MKRTSMILGVFSALAVSTALAAVSEDEARQLVGGELTRFGAEAAGNAEGTIPPYDPAQTQITPPADYKPGSGRYPNPFADDEPLFTISAENLDEYRDKLDEGTIALINRWPETYKLHVYPTRRTAPYPEWVLENTVKNATRANLINELGEGVEGAYGGIPFPIPKNGLEVLWNNFLYQQPVAQEGMSIGYLVDSNGSITNVGQNEGYFENQYYNPDKTQLDSPAYYKMLNLTRAPARKAGEGSLTHYSINYTVQDQTNWSYSPGQRRVRLAPEFKYDTPSASYGGGIFYDEIYLFSGRPDKFDWKLVGKKEVYIPYNSYDLTQSSPQEALHHQHLNPERVRWELHRVWEVEATLRPGERHAYSKRVFLFDEDSWKAVSATGYDQSGEIYRVGYQGPFQLYDPKAPYFYQSFWFYDLQKNQYLITPVWGDKGNLRPTDARPSYSTTASALQGTGLR